MANIFSGDYNMSQSLNSYCLNPSALLHLMARCQFLTNLTMSEGKTTSEKEFPESVKRSIVEEMEKLITMMKKCVADEF